MRRRGGATRPRHGTAVGNCSVVCGREQVMERLLDGLCGGVGCCRIDVWVPLRAFTLNLSRAGGGVSRDAVTFLVTGRERYAFRPSDLERGVDADTVAPALLDWAIPDRANCARATADRAVKLVERGCLSWPTTVARLYRLKLKRFT